MEALGCIFFSFRMLQAFGANLLKFVFLEVF